MGADTKLLARINYVTDTDMPYYGIGDPDGSFDNDSLKDYVKRFGHEKLCSHLAFMQFQIWDTVRQINAENDAKVASNSAGTA